MRLVMAPDVTCHSLARAPALLEYPVGPPQRHQDLELGDVGVVRLELAPQLPLEVLRGAPQPDGQHLGHPVDIRVLPAPVIGDLLGQVSRRLRFHGNKLYFAQR